MTYAEAKRTPLECMCRGQQEQCEWGGCCGTDRPRTPCQMCGNERHEHERRLQLIGDGDGLEPDENGRMRLVIRRKTEARK